MAALFLILSSLFGSAAATAVNNSCGSWDAPLVLCINKYASVLPGHFSRAVSTDPSITDSFHTTVVPDDATFASIHNATFLVFDFARAKGILGAHPSFNIMFHTAPVPQEAPVYVPELQRLYVTQVSTGLVKQIVIDVSVSPPTMEYMTGDPPLYAATGSVYHNGLVYYSTTGRNGSDPAFVTSPGIYTFDPKTNKTEALLNNYFGYFFNGADDLAIERNGDVWFTDDFYSWLDKTSTDRPALPPAIYRFRPSTGAVQVVHTGLRQPNGIRFSPSGKTLYVSDTGAASGPLSVPFDEIHYTWDSRGPRTLFAFDVVPSATDSDASAIVSGRPIYLSQDWVPDGIQVARNGYIVTATGQGVDVLDESGVLLARVQTPFRAASIAFAGEGLRDLWIVGTGNIARVRWNLQG
ncbi:hypothetical protein EYZ11_006615 [Aspergillus tanneri]|uniref:SMP-30/Gluconolactonase/LRE-like region domain-containing protein n=1 Tax=Aspergillus tanneri TaxID=1220188 RepID=A0A4S3JHA4_9EURO|nr:uncharacterized protein ATNIH1004_002223 [Aspergillus tanneri]KAA8649552.1 hypothetical protein ATNIH1004_002223 [Aspergillus tanneri]THC93897.1 hypothetical protein EYZ11_006615 [Aspergillus tanneri]